MVCPFCGNEMKDGTIPVVQNTVEWEEKRDGRTWGEVEHIKLSVSGILNPIAATAYYCADCRKVIVDVPEYESIPAKLDKKWNELTERAKVQRQERQTQREEEIKEKQREKRRKNDPWEV